MPDGNLEAQGKAQSHERILTKPIGSLGRLELIYEWLTKWQARYPALINGVQIAIFAGNHGVSKHQVSAYPS